MEDKLLVIRCKRGSAEALGRIYEKYKTDMLVLAMALLNDKSAAEDVMHDVFLSFVMNRKVRLNRQPQGLFTDMPGQSRTELQQGKTSSKRGAGSGGAC